MKYIVTIIAVAFLTIATQSQGLYNLTYTMGFGAGETNDFIGSASFRGATFEGQGFVSDQISVGGLFNWQVFYEELAGATYTDGTATLTGTQYRYINAYPMLLTAHYFMGTDEYAPRFYLGAGLGAYIVDQEVQAGVWEVSNNNWHFGMSPDIGMLYPIGMDSYLNLGLRYHYVIKSNDSMNFSWFGLNVGFAWGN
jgi:outer membrane protein W